MSYVIYDKESTYYLVSKTFATERAAKAHMTRYENKLARRAVVKEIYEGMNCQMDFREILDAMIEQGCTQREAYNASSEVPTFNRCDYAIAETGDFRDNIEKTRTTSNMLNPKSKQWEIPVNTPSYMDPGCESYHCM